MNNSRRTFIKQSGVILAGAALLPSFGLEASTSEKNKLAIQLFGLDSQMNANARQTLETIRSVGHRYIEHGNYSNRHLYGYTPRDFKKLVNDCGLDVLSGHAVLETGHWDKKERAFTTGWRQVIEDAVATGQKYLISPWLDKSLWHDEKALKDFMRVFNKCGELCRKEGLEFGYHNHHFEFSHSLGGMLLYDIILQHTDSNLVHQQLDIGNIDQEKFSFSVLFNQYPGRFPLLHIKNIIESSQRHYRYEPTAINRGVLNIKSIVEQARTIAGTTVFIVDQGVNNGDSVYESALMDYEVAKNNVLQ